MFQATTYEWVNTEVIGQTNEGRDLKVIQIAKAGAGKPNVFIDAGKENEYWNLYRRTI